MSPTGQQPDEKNPARPPGGSLEGSSENTERDPLAEQLPALAGPLREIANALRANTERETSRERHRRDRQFAFLQELRAAVEPFVAEFATEPEAQSSAHEGVSAANKKLGDLASPKHLRLRGSIGFDDCPACHIPDSWARMLGKQVSLLLGFIKAADQFEARREALDALVEESDSVFDRQDIVEGMRTDISGFVRAIEMVRDSMDEFPTLCTKLVTRVRAHHSRLQRLYNVEPDEKQSRVSPLLDLMGIDQEDPVLVKDNIPLYKGNVHLTALLNGLFQRIPQKAESESSKPAAEAQADKTPVPQGEEVDPAAVKSFCQDLLACGDPQLLELLRTGQGYMRMGRVLEGLHKAYTAFHKALEDGKLEAVLERDPDHRASYYANLIDSTLNAALGQMDQERPFQDFELGPVFQAIFNFKPAPKNPEASPIAVGKGETDKDRTILNIFRNIEGMLERLADKEAKVGEVELDRFVRDLIEQKGEVKQPEDRRRTARLARDRREGNFHYIVVQKGHGELSFQRAPTPNVTHDDVIGASWAIARKKMEPLLRHAELGYLYSQGSARGRLNYNMLIVGPYGCGKNHQMKAMFADPSVVTVACTADRVYTYWQYQTERNMRALFENAAAKREEHDRGVLIAFDEIHGLFPSKSRSGSYDSSGGSADRQQSILQSVLDGDTTYDGVALMAFTNHFSRIPPQIYRRFSDVVLIEGLTGPERETLMKRLLSALPLAPDFDARVKWDDFALKSQDASADMIGKIYDRVFKMYVGKFERAGRPALLAARDDFKRLALAGERITNSDRAEIYRTHAPNCVLEPGEFTDIALSLLAEPVSQELMTAQRKFFDSTRKEMRRAFGNKDSDTEP